MSLVEMLGKAALSQMTKQASTKTGLSEQAAAALMPMATAILMNGLKKNVAKPGGAEALAKALAKHDGSLLNDLGRVGNDDVVGDGRRILGHILGGKQGQTEAALAKAAGVNQDQVGALLAMAAPAILASLGKAKAQGGLDAGALAGLVKSESAKVAKDAPSELGGLLKWIDADGDGNVVEDIAAIAGRTLGGLFKKH
jgi:hypothetical protein